ncbi:hypothetical protein B0H63DRAFT_472097 [Podospora didyma]|uniref:Uncharacterized protein n=1 Tax=Podospora didyma TaxID=330526 RepID=A0AAE0TZ80_9PEZI|nr:hypothetical protein B0H63DRAFT_472097 [Podospora didyma]
MGVIKKTFYTGLLTGASVLGYLSFTTTIVSPLPRDDPALAGSAIRRFNVHRNPSTSDTCVKRIPLTKIRPELLEKDGDLVLEFCRGVWSGLGTRFQLASLARKYRGPATAGQLWTPTQFSESGFAKGTQMMDHFEVVEKTPTEIVVRCGDSPRNQGPRDSDGLFIISAVKDEAKGEVVLELKSCFFTSARKVEGIHGPMPGWMELLHRWYTRLWMVTGSQGLTRRLF